MRYPVPLKASPCGPLIGSARVPGDKSVSHRALILGGLAVGETLIHGLLEGEDVLNTAHAMKALGAKIHRGEDGIWHTFGVGTGHLREPDEILDMGNSGTSTRLLMGLVAGHPVTAFFTGDASLVKRPMGRVMTPLEQMGAQFMARAGGRLPLAVRGAQAPMPVSYRLPVASAQVKSAILLAGLSAAGTTTVIEPVPTRDHTENMFRHFGLDVSVEDLDDGARAIRIEGPKEFEGCAVDVPADPSSAAFPVVAAVLAPGSDLRLPGVCVNPGRTGLYETLREMGADLTFERERVSSGERVADLVVRGVGPLTGIDVPAFRVPAMIDEIPVLAMAAACASGVTRLSGLEELRVKESDRLATVAKGLADCGVRVEAGAQSLTIYGAGGPPPGGGHIETHLDHRIAMAFCVLGGAARKAVTIDDSRPVATSFPGFVDLMTGLGAVIEPADPAAFLARD
jgi:3-phosphoshikimate 1-carboxyvinyltransferase